MLFKKAAIKRYFVLFFFITTGILQAAQTSLDLSGRWRFALDPQDAGLREEWFRKDLSDEIRLPGVLQAQGYGSPISKDTPWVLSLYDKFWYLRQDYQPYAEGDVKVPFLSQPPRHYLGAAWYQRDIDIPKNWKGRRVVLFLERTRWLSTVWLNERQVGSDNSLVAPHVFDLGLLEPGRYRLTIRLDNRMLMDYRPDAHSVSDSLGSTWNGIVGRIELMSTSPVWLEDVQVYPNIRDKTVRVQVQIGNSTGQPGKGTLKAGQVRVPVSWTAEGGEAELTVSLGKNARLWDEFEPVLHRLTVELKGTGADDRREIRIGLRQISTDGPNLLVNGRRSHFRGTHSGGDFPLTGYPATDLAYWRNLFKTCREWGLNHMRFHSFCPPEAAFEAADELGFYLQPEAGMWNAISPGTAMEARMYEETERMIRAYGNHPSFVLCSPSNEPAGRWKESLPKWVEYYRQKDPRRLYTTGTGWPLIDDPGPVRGADFLAVHRVGLRPVRGNRAWFGGDYLASMQGVDVPIIVHELGQWCAYPDFDIIRKFTGYLRPGNYEIFRESAAAAGLLAKNKPFALASGMFQTACYKEEIEANLRTPGLAGFQLLDLHDYLGQGTALVGVLDAFWEEKGYVSARRWRRFCTATVPLAVLKKRTFTQDEPFEPEIRIAHYGAKPMGKTEVYWRIADKNGRIVRQGGWRVDAIELGSALPLGRVRTELADLPAPAMYRLIVGLTGTPFENDWNFWVYPKDLPEPAAADILITRSEQEAFERLQAGGKVLWMPHYNRLRWDCPPIGRLPIFWNRLMGPNWERFLGIVCEPSHPALKHFATDFYYDWQWEQVFQPACRVLNLADMPAELEPIVQVIDDWHRNYKLAAIFECRVGEGKLLVCAADLETNLSERPAARQLRSSLLTYMNSERFAPKTAVKVEQLRGLIFDNQIMKKLGAKIQTQWEDGRNAAANAVDGNPNTYWFTGRASRERRRPFELTIQFEQPVRMKGLVWMNRQDHRGHEGDVREYEVCFSEDGQEWSEPLKGRLESTFHPQQIDFGGTVCAQRMKIRALSGFGDDLTASAAEIAVIADETPPSGQPSQTGVYQRVRTATEEMFEGVD
ncbi:MAG TPA: discoidin domain-containing protein [Anaerohalosphaeraceae bacterium]|nr:discoidin domain-containing protein [Anaerohalosphaeraceae bacterium]HOL88286.1 discoidin domain-containing protein [Anaerohalosphaeraceae bacterium]HPP56698.1 discoidin domain-containing protein [Anaerohalosphaeraceae bacterium]